MTGAFDGNLESTRLTVDGKAVRVLAESRRKAVARLPMRWLAWSATA